MKKFGALIAVFVSACSICAGNKEETNFDFTHNRASITGMLTSACSWQLELGYHYMFNHYIGIGAAIGGWGCTMNHDEYPVRTGVDSPGHPLV